MLCDTHTHLFAEEFSNDIDVVISRAKAAGVTRFYLPNVDRQTVQPMNELCARYPGELFPAIGLHPCSVNGDYLEELKWVRKEAESKKYVAIGEIGIDLYWDKTFIQEQIDAFREQIQLAKTLGLPVIIHVRESFDDVFRVIDDLNDEQLSGIFHCFTGNLAQAEKILAYGGFMIGIGGVVTFKNSNLPEVLKTIGLNRLVLETDSPYLAPAPHRGKRNESAYLSLIVAKLAEITQASEEEIAAVTTQNALKIYGK